MSNFSLQYFNSGHVLMTICSFVDCQMTLKTGFLHCSPTIQANFFVLLPVQFYFQSVSTTKPPISSSRQENSPNAEQWKVPTVKDKRQKKKQASPSHSFACFSVISFLPVHSAAGEQGAALQQFGSASLIISNVITATESQEQLYIINRQKIRAQGDRCPMAPDLLSLTQHLRTLASLASPGQALCMSKSLQR